MPDAAANIPAGNGLILLCGPIARPGSPARGGYQSNNRRVIGVLQRQGHDVEELPYPEGAASPLGKALAYVRAFLGIAWRLATVTRRPAALHFTPLTRYFLFPEILCGAIARSRGIRIVIDLRAGVQIEQYQDCGALYRWVYRRFLRLADIVTYEGEVYAGLVAAIVPATPSRYFPNFVETSWLPSALPPRPPQLQLAYVGRVSIAKGALHAAQCLQRLQRSHPEAALTLIGGVDEDCRAAILALGAPHIRFTGALPPGEVRPYLDQSHYFMFLTHWWGEGHSNALTEAMGRGCVPVFSLRGFNPSVVGAAGLGIPDRDDIAAIAGRMLRNWEDGDWEAMAQAALARVRACYTDEAAALVLRDIYPPLPGKRA